ncbi:MAG: hypothetical protein ACRDEA_01860 [Microcystaceae cyanobacterium]
MTNPPQIIRHKRSARPTNPPNANAPVAAPPNPNSQALAAQANSAPVEPVSPASPESVILTEADPVVSDSPDTGNPTPYSGSNAIDEIRNDLRLERFQTFDDEQGRSFEPDAEGFSHNFSDEYLDFLLSFE